MVRRRIGLPGTWDLLKLTHMHLKTLFRLCTRHLQATWPGGTSRTLSCSASSTSSALSGPPSAPTSRP